MIALGKRVTSAGVRYMTKRNERGVRLWGIGIGWCFLGFVTLPKDQDIRASADFVDAQIEEGRKVIIGRFGKKVA